MSGKKIIVTGATGKQGGALIEALLASNVNDFTIYGLTRTASSGPAKKLAEKNVKIIEGDMTDSMPVFEKCGKDVWGVFLVTQNDKTEEQQGKAFVDAAVTNGVKHLIFSSVDRGGPKSDTDPTNVPHFISKHNVEIYLKEKAEKSRQGMSWTILRPVAFMDNLTPDFMGKTFATMVQQMGDTKLQLISTKDIGKVAAAVFQSPEKYKGKAITLAGDELSYLEMNEIFKEEVGTDMPTTFGFVGSLIKWMMDDLGKMFAWFVSNGYECNIPQLRKEFPEVEDFRTWLKNSSKFQTK